MRKLIPLLMLLLLLPVAALAASADMTLTPEEYGFTYTLQAEGNEFVVLIWEGKNETGRRTLYSEDGHFEGRVELPYSGMGGKFTVTVQNLKQNRLARQSITLPQAADYVAPPGKANATVRDLTLEETAQGFRFAFTAPETDYMLLYYRSKQESAVFPVYPVDDTGRYEGEVIAPLTYCRTLFTVQVRNAKGQQKDEATCRKAWEIPEMPEAREGRLSGVVVCIDPGHQENGQFVREPIGPGLSGTTVGKGGMAQGKVTLRKEDIVVLETAIILRDLLLQEGATVVMTRHAQDDFRTNIDRCNIAEEAGADILLRLHINMNDNRNKTGIQIYGPRNSDYAKAVADAATYRAMGEILLTEMKKATGLALEQKTGNVLLNDDYVGNNWAKMTCFLVEMGYMSNIGEDIKLATPEYQTMLAKGMVEGVYQIALMRGWLN